MKKSKNSLISTFVDTNQIYYVILRRCSNSPIVFVRKGGGYSSLVTADCLFTHNEAWSEMRQHPCDLSKYEVLFTRQVNGTTGIIGLSPDEILSAKKTVSLKPSGKRNQEIKEEIGNAKKKKKTSAPIESGGLFDGLGENWESENESGQSRNNRPYNIF